MRRFGGRIILGTLLIAAGVLSLLQNLTGIQVGGLFWSLLFGIAGVVFLCVFLTDRSGNWWAIVLGIVLLSLAMLIALDQLAPKVGGDWGGVIFLGGVGLSFWVVYLNNTETWWAVIPGGTLITLAVVAGLSNVAEGFETGGVFLLGLGLTFGLLTLLPTQSGRMRWALIPAAILVVMGMLITASATAFMGIIWAVVPILIGIYLLFRVFVPRREA